jgi:hypothetical protein
MTRAEALFESYFPLFNILTLSHFNSTETHHNGDGFKSVNTALLYNP